MIVDCFMFFEEFDVLELRLRTLEDVVDRFVICEAPFTFRGKPKPLHLAAALGRYERWRDRITLLTYPGPPNEGGPWETERDQRDYLTRALADCAPDDLVLISDLDEIPDPRLVAQRPNVKQILGHRMVHADGYVNRLADNGARLRHGTRAIVARDLVHYVGLGDVHFRPLDELEFIDSGWHFTSIGGAAVMERKARAYSHAENDIPYFRDLQRLEVAYESDSLTWWPVDERLPLPISQDRARWAPFIWKEQASIDARHAGALEHAHGCFAYIPEAAPSVAVLTRAPAAWLEAGPKRFGGAFAGAFADVASLLGATSKGSHVIVDGLEQQSPYALSALWKAGLEAVVFAANARSFEVFRRVLGGEPGNPPLFPPGRALGRNEYAAEIDAAGYRIDGSDRVCTRKIYVVPQMTDTYEKIALELFAFPTISGDALFDFMSDAFVFSLNPI